MKLFVSSSENVMEYWVENSGNDFVVLAGWDAMPSARDTREGLTWITQEIEQIRPGMMLEVEYTDAVKETENAKARRTKSAQDFLTTGQPRVKTIKFEKPPIPVSNPSERLVQHIRHSIQAQVRRQGRETVL